MIKQNECNKYKIEKLALYEKSHAKENVLNY